MVEQHEKGLVRVTLVAAADEDIGWMRVTVRETGRKHLNIKNGRKINKNLVN